MTSTEKEKRYQIKSFCVLRKYNKFTLLFPNTFREHRNPNTTDDNSNKNYLLTSEIVKSCATKRLFAKPTVS